MLTEPSMKESYRRLSVNGNENPFLVLVKCIYQIAYTIIVVYEGREWEIIGFVKDSTI